MDIIWSVEHLAQAMSGDHHALVKAFRWSGTPQGYRYWVFRAHGDVPLSDKDRDYLAQLYADAVKHRLGLGS